MSDEKMENQAMKKEGCDRRRFFRIDDNVLMSLHRIDQKNVDEELERFDQKRDAFCFMNNTELDRDQQLSNLSIIQQKNPEIANYINYLEARLDVLTKIISSQHDDPDEQDFQVNFSAQGMRFHTNLIYDSEDLVEIRLTLLPSRKRLLLIGTIVWCVEDAKAPGFYKQATAIDFTYINEDDREVLAKHIHNKQIEQLTSTKYGE